MSDLSSLSRAERQKIQLQQDIIQAAFLEFSERGYHQTAIADIATRLGIGHGTFYRHFQNKRDILEKVIIDTVTKINSLLTGENAPAAVSTLAAYQEQCERIAERLIAFAQDNPLALKLILLEATSIDAEMTQYVQSMIQMSATITAHYLQNGVEQGFLRQDLDTEATAHAIIGMITNGALRFLTAPDDLTALENYAVSVIQLIVQGMKN